MPRLTIKETIMNRDNITSDQADILINDALDQFEEYLVDGDEEGMTNICQEFFGLEPDYIDDLI